HRAVRQGILDRSDDHVAHPGVPTRGTAQHPDTQDLFGTGVVGDLAARLLLDHVLLRPLDDLDDPPPFRLADGSGLGDPCRVVELTRRQLEAQVEELFLRALDPDVQLVVRELSELDRLARHPYSPTLVMNFVLIGNLCCARNIASRASGSFTPDSSNMTRPGFTTATQPSGLPFPEPIRVSAGFFVTGLSGKIVIQTFPPRLM